ncbi:MAG TPA: histidine kinase dimerization/phospho-acceptor domain-containing protein, partial [Taishania sp.]|nr:histidine kinase dimerization/phospho-acceptor domain-containing protein [Taishania sp.]
MLVIFVIVVVTGLLAYFRFSTILGDISKAVRPDKRLVLAQSIQNHLEELSNIAKTHSLTDDNSYRKNYIQIRNTIWEELDEFKDENKDATGEIDLNQLDSLINDRMIVLDGIMYAEDPFRVQTALGKVIKNIDVKPAKDIAELRNNNLKDAKSNVNPEIKLEEIKTTSDKLETISKEERKLLRKKKRAEKKNNESRIAELDSVLETKRAEAKEAQRKLLKIDEFENDKVATVNNIYKGIEIVSTEELLIEKEIKSVQLGLISMENLLSLKIAKIFDDFELIENKRFQLATEKAESENREMNTYLAIFCAFFALLLFVTIYMIFQYVNKNNLYRIALKKSAQETERLTKTREKFIATITHELRTPLHAIVGFSEQLGQDNLNQKQREYVSMIQNSSQHLQYLINDVLDLTKLQSGKLKINKIPFDFKRLIQEVENSAKELIPRDQIVFKGEIDKEIDDKLLGDEYRLRQILLNIVSNAIKFTKNGEVSMRASVQTSNQSNQVIQIEVQDTGIGM